MLVLLFFINVNVKVKRMSLSQSVDLFVIAYLRNSTIVSCKVDLEIVLVTKKADSPTSLPENWTISTVMQILTFIFHSKLNPILFDFLKERERTLYLNIS